MENNNDIIYRQDVFDVLDEVMWISQEEYERINFLIYSIPSVESHEVHTHITNEIELLKLENEMLKRTIIDLSNGDIDNDNRSKS